MSLFRTYVGRGFSRLATRRAKPCSTDIVAIAAPRCRQAGGLVSLIPSLLLLISLTNATSANAEVPFSLEAVEEVCTTNQNHYSNKAAVIERLQSDGWTYEAEPQRPPAMLHALMAMVYSVPQLKSTTIKDWAEALEPVNHNRFGDFLLEAFKHDNTRLTIGSPSIGLYWCSLVGDDGLETVMRQTNLEEIDFFPVSLTTTKEWPSDLSRRLYQGNFSKNYTAFLAVVDKPALSAALGDADIDQAVLTKVFDAIPQFSAMIVPNYAINRNEVTP